MQRREPRGVFCTFLIRATCRSVLPAILSFGLLTALARGAEPVPRNWMVDGVRREALVHVPVATGEPAPLVFVFHGHGGTARNAARTFSIHTHWPEAVVVYPQGLNTPGRLTDPEGRKPGWQHGPGEQGDRDLKFFDAMLAQLIPFRFQTYNNPSLTHGKRVRLRRRAVSAARSISWVFKPTSTASRVAK